MTNQVKTPPETNRSILVPALTATVLAAAANALIYGLAKAAGLDLLEKSGDGTVAISLMAPIAATLAAMLVGTVVAWLVTRARPSAAHPLAIAGLVFAVVSCFAPLTRTVGLADGLVLCVMHLVAGALWFGALTRR